MRFAAAFPRSVPWFPDAVGGAQQMKAEKALEWKKLYQKAISQSDPEQVPEDIARAEAALLSRSKKLTLREADEPERRAINDALATLRVLKAQHLPGWK